MGLKTDLAGIIPQDLLSHLPDGYEIIGNIAIISVPPSLELYFKDIANALLSRRPSLITILNKISTIKGKERTAHYYPIFGEVTITEVREFGFRYKLDIREVYFSTKMASQRTRIHELIHKGETIFVPFAGIGPYAIPAATCGAEVYAVEISRPACAWMARNAIINDASSHLHIIRGDALHAADYLKFNFSRIIIPTPYGLLKSPDIFLTRLIPGGTAHWITFCNKNQIIEYIEELTGDEYEVTYCHKSGNIAPSVSRWILDIKKKKCNDNRTSYK